MGRHVRDYRLGSRDARSKLRRRTKPYWREIYQGLHVGYRKGKKGGAWLGRKYLGDQNYKVWRLGLSDDVEDADGVNILSFKQADDTARKGPPGHGTAGVRTIRDVLADYMEYQKVKARSWEVTRYIVDKRILPELGDIALDKLSVSVLEDWKNKLAKGGKRREGESRREAERRKKSSANRVLTVLKAALNYAEKTGKYSGPAIWRRVERFPKVGATERRFLDEGECSDLLEKCDPDFLSLVRGALETGCRYGELTSMEVRDYDAESKLITVRQTKGGNARHSFLTSSGVELFDALTADRKARETLFLRVDGIPWKKSAQIRPMKEACKAAEIDPPISFKGLRTTYGSLLAKAGVSLQVIAQSLGHADTRITEEHYAHLLPSHVADAVRENLPSWS